MHTRFGIVCRCLALESKIISVPELRYLVLQVTTDAIGNSQPAGLNRDFDMMQADYEVFCDCLFVAKWSKHRLSMRRQNFCSGFFGNHDGWCVGVS